MTHPRQIPELAAHGGGGPKDGGHKRGLGPQGTPTAPYRPSPPGHLYLHRAEPGSTSLPEGAEAEPGELNVISGHYHFSFCLQGETPTSPKEKMAWTADLGVARGLEGRGGAYRCRTGSSRGWVVLNGARVPYGSVEDMWAGLCWYVGGAWKNNVGLGECVARILASNGIEFR